MVEEFLMESLNECNPEEFWKKFMEKFLKGSMQEFLEKIFEKLRKKTPTRNM